MTNIEVYGTKTFDEHKHINEYGEEFWYARDLQKILHYDSWQNFSKVMERAKESCENSKYAVSDHFNDIIKMIDIGKGAERGVQDWMLSRYACYLIVQNADPKKGVVAQGQTYFAIQTRKQELQEELQSMNEDSKRIAIRNELKEHNKSLAEAAKNAGVETYMDYAVFQNHGYRGLYGGRNSQDIHARKGLKKSQRILDHMGSTELAANLFRATQTDEKLRRENIERKEIANDIHYTVGEKVRQTIEDLGGVDSKPIIIHNSLIRYKIRHGV